MQENGIVPRRPIRDETRRHASGRVGVPPIGANLRRMMHAWTPEASWKLAGGRASAASEHHRNTTQANIRPGGGGGNPVRAFSSAPSGAHSFLPQYSGGVRFARPPADFRCPSGTLAQTPASLLTAMFHACPKLALMGVPPAVLRILRSTRRRSACVLRASGRRMYSAGRGIRQAGRPPYPRHAARARVTLLM